MLDQLKTILRRLFAGAKASPATTTVAAIPLLIGATIQVLYGFDADPDTHTDWNLVITSVFGAIGFTLAQDVPPPPTPPASPTTPPTRQKVKK